MSKKDKIMWRIRKLFWYTVSSFAGSMVCLFWLPFITAISIFVALSITRILIEFLDFLYEDFKKNGVSL
jgi:hypothetical protein